jgi:pimeloyl-ACP methyl ester carboxylesterase
VKPVLLLVAGMLNDERVWADVAVDLQAQAEVRTVLPLQDSVPAMAAAAWARLDDVPPQVPVVLAGFSLGGYVVLEMLAQPRRPLHAVALLSTSARPESPEGAALRDQTVAALQADFSAVVDTVVRRGTHGADPGLQQWLRTMMRDVGAPVAIRQTRAIRQRGDHRRALAGVDLPALVMCGRQDRITPPALAEELAALLPRSRLVLVDGAGHMLPCEQPQAVVQALQALLISRADGPMTTPGDNHHAP